MQIHLQNKTYFWMMVRCHWFILQLFLLIFPSQLILFQKISTTSSVVGSDCVEKIQQQRSFWLILCCLWDCDADADIVHKWSSLTHKRRLPRQYGCFCILGFISTFFSLELHTPAFNNCIAVNFSAKIERQI